MLSKELELSLEQNQELNEDVQELKAALNIRERQLIAIAGSLPGYDEHWKKEIKKKVSQKKKKSKKMKYFFVFPI